MSVHGERLEPRARASRRHLEGRSIRSDVGVERRWRGLKARGGRRDAPGEVLKDRRSPRRRGRMGTSVRKSHLAARVKKHELAPREAAVTAAAEEPRLEPPPVLRRRRRVVRRRDEEDRVRVARALDAPRARERIRLEHDDVVGRFELRQPVRGGFPRERADAGLANLRESRRAVRDARDAVLGQCVVHRGAELVERERSAFADGDDGDGPRRGRRRARGIPPGGTRGGRVMMRAADRGAAVRGLDPRRDAHAREVDAAGRMRIRIRTAVAGMWTVAAETEPARCSRAHPPRERHERPRRAQREGLDARPGDPQELRVADRARAQDGRRRRRRRPRETAARAERRRRTRLVVVVVVVAIFEPEPVAASQHRVLADRLSGTQDAGPPAARRVSSRAAAAAARRAAADARIVAAFAADRLAGKPQPNPPGHDDVHAVRMPAAAARSRSRSQSRPDAAQRRARAEADPLRAETIPRPHRQRRPQPPRERRRDASVHRRRRPRQSRDGDVRQRREDAPARARAQEHAEAPLPGQEEVTPDALALGRDERERPR
eukprot:30394-Pelagococcus_subviridis.AAC.6